MTTSLHTPSSVNAPSTHRPPGAARCGRLAACGALGLATALVVVLAGCGGDSGDAADHAHQAPPAEPVSVADLPRFPSPPASRSLGAMDEPDDQLVLPLGAADAAGEVAVRQVEGRVFRRVSTVSTGTGLDTVLDHYRGLIAEGGYEVVFACEGVEPCGGERFVSEVIEGYVTAPGNVSRASTVIALTRPTSGELAHFSLARDQGGVAEYVGITVVRSEKGPMTVVTQHAFVVEEN